MVHKREKGKNLVVCMYVTNPLLVLAIPNITLKNVYPPINLLSTPTPTTVEVEAEVDNTTDLLLALVPTDVSCVFDLVQHVLHEPDRELFFVCDVDRRSRADC